jgi:hypothetical protein
MYHVLFLNNWNMWRRVVNAKTIMAAREAEGDGLKRIGT